MSSCNRRSDAEVSTRRRVRAWDVLVHFQSVKLLLTYGRKETDELNALPIRSEAILRQARLSIISECQVQWGNDAHHHSIIKHQHRSLLCVSSARQQRSVSQILDVVANALPRWRSASSSRKSVISARVRVHMVFSSGHPMISRHETIEEICQQDGHPD